MKKFFFLFIFFFAATAAFGQSFTNADIGIKYSGTPRYDADPSPLFLKVVVPGDFFPHLEWAKVSQINYEEFKKSVLRSDKTLVITSMALAGGQMGDGVYWNEVPSFPTSFQ